MRSCLAARQRRRRRLIFSSDLQQFANEFTSEASQVLTTIDNTVVDLNQAGVHHCAPSRGIPVLHEAPTEAREGPDNRRDHARHPLRVRLPAYQSSERIAQGRDDAPERRDLLPRLQGGVAEVDPSPFLFDRVQRVHDLCSSMLCEKTSSETTQSPRHPPRGLPHSRQRVCDLAVASRNPLDDFLYYSLDLDQHAVTGDLLEPSNLTRFRTPSEPGKVEAFDHGESFPSPGRRRSRFASASFVCPGTRYHYHVPFLATNCGARQLSS